MHRASQSIDASGRTGLAQGALLARPSLQVRRASMSAVTLPPPPARSSLKKPLGQGMGRPQMQMQVGETESATTTLLATSASDASLSTELSVLLDTPRACPGCAADGSGGFGTGKRSGGRKSVEVPRKTSPSDGICACDCDWGCD